MTINPDWISDQIKTLGFPIVVCSALLVGLWRVSVPIVDSHLKFLAITCEHTEQQTKILGDMRNDSAQCKKTIEANAAVLESLSKCAEKQEKLMENVFEKLTTPYDN